MELKNDPLGLAVLDYAATKLNQDIIVSSDLCDDDVIPSSYLFRSLKEMPKIEKLALERCIGQVLDVGAGAGCHSIVLKNKGLNVKTLEPSKGAFQYLQSIGLDVVQEKFLNHSGIQYDTILILMNGIGLAGNLDNLPSFLEHAKSLLKPNGKILCDSTDVMYLYENEDGSLWIDLNAKYYGNFKFKMSYKDHQTDWFDWLYVDFHKLKEKAENVGLKVELIYEEDYHFLVELTL